MPPKFRSELEIPITFDDHGDSNVSFECQLATITEQAAKVTEIT